MNKTMNKKRFKPKAAHAKTSASVSALDKLIFFLSRRDHTELELKRKLAKDFSLIEVDAALASARELNLMKTPEQLSEQLYHELSRKNKGYLYIIKYLRAKGLPRHEMDHEQELEKARKLVMTKLRLAGFVGYEEKIKIHRLLTSRGFAHETIREMTREATREATRETMRTVSHEES